MSVQPSTTAAHRSPESHVALARPAYFVLGHPEVAASTSALGAALREATELSPAVVELAALTVAVARRSTFGVSVHRQLAKSAGVAASVVDAVTDAKPVSFDDDDQAVTFEVTFEIAQCLLAYGRIPTDIRQRAAAVFNPVSLAELVMVIAYHDMMALAVAAFDD